MPNFLRRLLRAFAIALVLAPFAHAVKWAFDENVDLRFSLAYFGADLVAPFFLAPAGAGALIWWLAGFIREPDDDETA